MLTIFRPFLLISLISSFTASCQAVDKMQTTCFSEFEEAKPPFVIYSFNPTTCLNCNAVLKSALQYQPLVDKGLHKIYLATEANTEAEASDYREMFAEVGIRDIEIIYNKECLQELKETTCLPSGLPVVYFFNPPQPLHCLDMKDPELVQKLTALYP